LKEIAHSNRFLNQDYSPEYPIVSAPVPIGKEGAKYSEMRHCKFKSTPTQQADEKAPTNVIPIPRAGEESAFGFFNRKQQMLLPHAGSA
jgi:hypothetical protein